MLLKRRMIIIIIMLDVREEITLKLKNGIMNTVCKMRPRITGTIKNNDMRMRLCSKWIEKCRCTISINNSNNVVLLNRLIMSCKEVKKKFR